MPARWRSRLRSARGAVTSMPSTTMRPSCTFSSPLMQRSMVDLPEPERPMTATISPFSSVSETPFSTSTSPKRLRTPDSSTSGMELPFQRMAELGEREADDEIDRRRGEVDGERGEGRTTDDLARPRKLDEADQRRQRGVLHQLHQEPDCGRNTDADRLRQHHVGQPLRVCEAEGCARLPLALGYGLQAAAPDLAEEGGGVDRKRPRR